MTDLDLDAIEHRADKGWVRPDDMRALVAALREARAEVERLRTGEADSIAVLSVAWPTTTVPWIAETGVAACVSLLTAERDDWRRRYEALRDGVTEAVEGSLYVGTSLAATIRAVVARVEGDES